MYRLLIVFLLLGGLPLLAQVAAPVGKTQQKPFSPIQAPPNAQYVGSQICAQCHEKHARHQINSSMGQALQPCASCDVLRANPSLTWQSGKYIYKIERKGEQSWYTVTDGVNTVTEPILWCFSKGDTSRCSKPARPRRQKTN
jgi:hypothetical protein